MNKVDSAETSLHWFEMMGVDEVILDTPQNREHTPEVAHRSPKPVNSSPAPQNNQSSSPKVQPKASVSSSVITDTRAIADQCTSIEALREAVYQFKGLGISKMASNVVFSDGQSNAKVMMIGEAPGAEEDKQGIPFCGASGQLLDQILATIDLSRSTNLYITNTIFWRPPGNRKPTPEELATCLPFVQKHIELIRPELIILVGGTAMHSLMGMKGGITKQRGKFHSYTNPYLQGQEIPLTIVFHPSYLLRSPGQKRMMWYDMQTIRHHLAEQKVTLD